MKLRKGDKITLLTAVDGPVIASRAEVGKPLPESPRGARWANVFRPNGKLSHVVPVYNTDEGRRWMYGWGEETSNALLAASAMAEPARPTTNLPPGALAGAFAHIAGRVGTAIGLSPLVSAGLGALAGAFAEAKLTKKP